MILGTIFSIEEFAIHDGPGIRTTIFMKGCPLRCAWCHNPEGLSFEKQELNTKNGRVPCGEVYNSDELAERMLKNAGFFQMNGGGVTLTGGEPMAQPQFVIDFLEKIEPLHKVIETSGYTSPSVFEKVISLVDLVLFDIKHTDPEIHKKFTGFDNRLILNNLRILIDSGKEFIIRLPLIPGVNDTYENMMSIYSLIKNASSLIRIEFLPYHRTAGAKYEMTGQVYQPPFDPEQKPRIYNVFEQYSIKTITL